VKPVSCLIVKHVKIKQYAKPALMGFSWILKKMNVFNVEMDVRSVLEIKIIVPYA
jgi:hypothetical protein